MTKILLATLTAGSALATMAYATSTLNNTTDPIEIVGSVTNEELIQEHLQYLKTHPEAIDDSNLWLSSRKYVPNYIHFMKIRLNPNYKPQNLTSSQEHELKNLVAAYPSQKVLPLTGPPLNQGQFNTCVTFATIGSEISANFLSDYNNQPSPSCMLNYMVSNSNHTSNPWDGTTISYMISNIRAGINVRNSVGGTGFCNSSYPIYEPYGSWGQDGQGLTISFNTFNSQAIFYQYHAINSTGDNSQNLDLIKKELNSYPAYLPLFSFNYVPTMTTMTINSEVFGVWLDSGTTSTNYHAIYAYGYNDNLCIQGQCGVLYLRNSWGYYNTSNGDYLMTYQYFMNHYNKYDSILSF